MATVVGVVLALALLFCSWNLVIFVFSGKRRKKAANFFGFGVLALVVSAAVLGNLLDDEARNAGFSSFTEMRVAKDAGITDAAEWQIIQTKAEAVLAAQALEREGVERQIAEENAAIAAGEEAAKVAAAEVERQRAVEEEVAKVVACRDELSCWGERVDLYGQTACAGQVERLANFDFEWTDGLFGLKFTHYRWADKQAGIVSIVGDAIKFQNGFGTWSYYIYECDINPENGLISAVRAEPGRL